MNPVFLDDELATECCALLNRLTEGRRASYAILTGQTAEDIRQGNYNFRHYVEWQDVCESKFKQRRLEREGIPLEFPICPQEQFDFSHYLYEVATAEALRRHEESTNG